MVFPTTRCIPTFVVVLICWLSAGAVVNGQETIHVGPTQLYTTIQDAANHAIANKALNIETIIMIEPGIYREFIDLNTYTNWPSNDPNNATKITFYGPGAVVSGSDVFDQWVNTNGNRYEHVWLHDWGVGPDPTNGVQNVADIVRRRELVYVDGERMTQVLTIGELGNNTFFVDEANDVIVLQTNKDVANSTVEVGVRDRLYKQEWESNVTLDGLTFVHAATEWNDVDSAVKFNGATNATIRNCVLTENNSRGILFTSVKGVTLNNVQMNDNGWNGWATWRVTDFVAYKTETSRNNWRGHLGAFYTWNVGNKLLATHGIDIRNHLAVDNLSRGLWLDLDNENVVMDSVIVNGNLSDGMFIEANQGPIVIINSEFNNNGGEALLVANSDSVTLRDNEFLGNAKNWFRFTGSAGGRGVTDFETKERYILFSKNWVIRNNLIEVTDPTYSIFFNQILASAFDGFVETLDADSNTYIHTGRTDAFHDRSNSDLNFDEWKAFSGVDSYSTFTTHPYGEPTARYSFLGDSLTVDFDATLSTDDGPLQYDWDFGDGSTDSGALVTKVFAAAGTYPVLLTVTDANLQTDTVSVGVSVPVQNDPPQAAFSYATTYLSAELDASASTDDWSISSFSWDFGDGSTDVGEEVQYAYAAEGSYTVTLVVYDYLGLSDTLSQIVQVVANTAPVASYADSSSYLNAHFDASSSTDDSSISTYEWAFGDGATDTGEFVDHVYADSGNYAITLVVIDDFGLSDTTTGTIDVSVNPPPIANFSFVIDELTVDFDGSSSTDDSTLVAYDWGFGDDSTASGVAPTHTFGTAGDYTVLLTVTDFGGLTDTMSQVVTVQGQHPPPTASFSFAVDSLTVSVDASTSTDDAGIAGYRWSFGDDSTGTGLSATHDYQVTGSYLVQLVVENIWGLTDTLQQTVDVVAPTIELSTTVFLSGPFGSGQMFAYLSTLGELPLSQPYADTAYQSTARYYTGSESVVAMPYPDIVDWVLLELRSDTTSATVRARRAAFVRANGSVVDLDGTAVTFPWVEEDLYYLVVSHRNHVSVMSAVPMDFSGGTASYDFTTSATQAYGTASQVEVEPGVFALCAGDADSDELVDASDDMLWLLENGRSGYRRSDYNLSGGVTTEDHTILLLFSGHATRVPQ